MKTFDEYIKEQEAQDCSSCEGDKKHICPTCNGQGSPPGSSLTCSRCRGKGEIPCKKCSDK